MKNIVKVSLVSSLLISPIPSLAMDGGNTSEAKSGESIISKEDLEGHMLIPKVASKEGIVKDIVPQIQRARISQDFFSLTCPSVDEIKGPNTSTGPLDPVNHDGINFRDIMRGYRFYSDNPTITFTGVDIKPDSVSCRYTVIEKHIMGGDARTYIRYVPDINADCKVHHASEKFHEKTEQVWSEVGPVTWYSYTSGNPQDIKIICKRK